MTEFAIYELKSAAALFLFYLFYKLLLSKDTLHRLNRVILVTTAVISMILPLVVITIKTEEVGNYGIMPDVLAGELATNASDSITWANIVLFIGMAISLTTILISIVKTILLIRSGELVNESNGIRTVVLNREVAPFSWMKTIALSRSDWESGDQTILIHERAHVELHHSWDVLIVDILTSIQWFNPAMWLLRDDLRAIHEFQADDKVLRSGVDARQYQLLLVKKSVTKAGYSVVNGFSHSLLKKRIVMMVRRKTKSRAYLKTLYLIPAVCICLAANARTVYITDLENDAVSLDSVEVKPKFNGGNLNQFSLWVNERINYPKEAVNANIHGRVTVSFVVSKDGTIKDINILNGVNELLDAEVVRVVGMAPQWTPGMMGGNHVDVLCSMPITFNLKSVH